MGKREDIKTDVKFCENWPKWYTEVSNIGISKSVCQNNKTYYNFKANNLHIPIMIVLLLCAFSTILTYNL